MIQRFSAALLEFGYPPCPGEWWPVGRNGANRWQLAGGAAHDAAGGQAGQLLRLSIWPMPGRWPATCNCSSRCVGNCAFFADGGERWLADIAAAACNSIRPDLPRPTEDPGRPPRSQARRDLPPSSTASAPWPARRPGDPRDPGTDRGAEATPGPQARLADGLSRSFELFLQLRLTRQLAGQRDGRQQGLDVSGMSRHDRDMLRYGLHVVKKFQAWPVNSTWRPDEHHGQVARQPLAGLAPPAVLWWMHEGRSRRRVISLDLETTNLDPRRAERPQHGAVLVRRGKLVMGGAWNSTSSRRRAWTRSRSASKLRRADLEGQLQLEQALRQLLALIGDRPLLGLLPVVRCRRAEPAPAPALRPTVANPSIGISSLYPEGQPGIFLTHTSTWLRHPGAGLDVPVS